MHKCDDGVGAEAQRQEIQLRQRATDKAQDERGHQQRHHHRRRGADAQHEALRQHVVMAAVTDGGDTSPAPPASTRTCRTAPRARGDARRWRETRPASPRKTIARTRARCRQMPGSNTSASCMPLIWLISCPATCSAENSTITPSPSTRPTSASAPASTSQSSSVGRARRVALSISKGVTSGGQRQCQHARATQWDCHRTKQRRHGHQRRDAHQHQREDGQLVQILRGQEAMGDSA